VTPVPDVHPSADALAEFVGGPGDAGGPSPAGDPMAPARIGEHLDRCPTCREEVARLRAASDALASLAEPELPPGFHDRLVAAVRAEQGTLDRREDRVPAAALSPPRREGAAARRARARWHRPFGWAVAAAATVVLAVAGVSQLGQQGAFDTAAGGGSGGGSAQGALPPEQGATTFSGNLDSAPEVASAAPRFQAAGNYDLARLAKDVASRPDLRAAYQNAFESARRAGLQSAPGPASTVQGEARGAPSTKDSTKSQGDDGDSGAAAGGGGGACAPPVPGGPGVLLIEADYAGRPATMVVEVGGRPPTVTMRAYAQDDCTLLDTVRGPAPAP
jgi:hypothetical protein